MNEIPSIGSLNQGDAEERSGKIDSMPSFGLGELDAEHGVVLKDWSAQDFANIYVRFRPHLLRHARRFLREESLAEEVVQDAFLYLMTALPELDSELGVLRFLKWKTKMLCLDVLKSGKGKVDENLSLDDFSSTALSPSEAVERAEDLAIIQLALARLNPRHRQALLLSVYEEAQAGELGDRMDLSGNGFRQLLLRARRSFKLAISEEAARNGRSVSDILLSISKRGALKAGIFSVAALALGLGAFALLPNNANFAVEVGQQNSFSLAYPEIMVEKVEESPGVDEAKESNGFSDPPVSQGISRRTDEPILFANGVKEATDGKTKGSNLEGVPVASHTVTSSQPDESVAALDAAVLGSLDGLAVDDVAPISADFLSFALNDDVSLGLVLSYEDPLSSFFNLESRIGEVAIAGVPRTTAAVLETGPDGQELVLIGTDFLFGDVSGFADFSTTETRHVSASAMSLRVLLRENGPASLLSATWIAREETQ